MYPTHCWRHSIERRDNTQSIDGSHRKAVSKRQFSLVQIYLCKNTGIMSRSAATRPNEQRRQKLTAMEQAATSCTRRNVRDNLIQRKFGARKMGHLSIMPIVRAWQNGNFPDQWVGRQGPVEWSARSYLKYKAYLQYPKSIPAVTASIKRECELIPVELCEKVCGPVLKNCK